MKPFYVVILMGAAAIGGGLVVRYNNHPAQITLAHPTPPTVVAPPVAPIEHIEHVGRQNSAPVRPPVAPAKTTLEKPVKSEKPVRVEKPSAFGKQLTTPALAKPARPAPERPTSDPPRAVARVRIPPEPPAIIEIARNVADPPPAPIPAPAPVPVAKPSLPPPPPPPEPNHATLKAGMLITVRITEALSTNTNSPGDVFSGILEKPLIAGGFVIAERGAHVRGEVVESKSAVPGQGPAELSIRLREIASSDGQRIHVVSSSWKKQGTAASVPTGSVYDVALTRDGAAVIRPATSITFRLDEAVELTEKQH